MLRKICLGVVLVSAVACDQALNEKLDQPDVTEDPGSEVGEDPVLELAPNQVVLQRCAVGEGTLTEVHTATTGVENLSSVRPGPDGQLMLFTWDGQMILWNPSEDAAILSTAVEGSYYRSASIDQSESFLLESGDIGPMRLWDLPGREIISEIDLAPEQALQVQLGPDAQWAGLGMASWDEPLAWMDLAQGELRTGLTTGLTQVTTMTYLPLRDQWLTAGHQDYMLSVVELRDATSPNAPQATWTASGMRCGGNPVPVALQADSREEKLLVVSGQMGYGHLAVVNLEDASSVNEVWLWDHDPMGGAFLPGDQTIVTTGYDATVRFWDAETLEQKANVAMDNGAVGLVLDESREQVHVADWSGMVHTYACVSEE